MNINSCFPSQEKTATLDRLKVELQKVKITNLSRQSLEFPQQQTCRLAGQSKCFHLVTVEIIEWCGRDEGIRA